MSTKINRIQGLAIPHGVMSASWLARQGISRTEQANYVKSGWLERVAAGTYRFKNDVPTLFGTLASYGTLMGFHYRIGAHTALELHGFTHYLSLGKPQAFVFTRAGHRLPKWMAGHEWDQTLREFSTKVFDEALGATQVERDGMVLDASSPELAIMECLLLSPQYYSLIDVYHLMEMLTTLRSGVVTKLLEQCSSVKVKRLFLYMAEKSMHAWFRRLDLANVTLGSGVRSLAKGGVKIAKYNLVVPQELANYE